MHGGIATLIQSLAETDTFQGKTVWEGVVHVFDLADNPKADRPPPIEHSLGFDGG